MEFTGKSVAEAIKQGLSVLGIEEKDADIVVVKEAVKGIFGKIKENAVVEIKEKKENLFKEEKVTNNECVCEEKKEKTAKKECCKKKQEIDSEMVLEFTKTILDMLEIDAELSFSDEGENPVVTLKSETSSKLIGFRGEVLDALQVLVGAKANVGKTEYQKVVVDCENYREKREETLISLAKKLEAKATDMRREVILEPMNAFERRIIHSALANSQTVTTRSDGKDPNRYVVIVPNDLDKDSKPYNAGRRNDDRNSRNGFNKKSNFKGNKNFKSNRPQNKGFKNNFGEPKKKSSGFSFGTYLGNSLKDDN